MTQDIFSIPSNKLGCGSPIALEILDGEQDLYYDIALSMYEQIKENNEKGKNTVFICPVGPVGQYRKLARMVNNKKLNMKNVYIFQMDEYLDDNKQLIESNNPLSFCGFMKREFYDQVEDSLNVPEENRFFPIPGKEDSIWDTICELGGVDCAYGGIGINGHIAFNEPPEVGEIVTADEFKNRKTRILKITRETRTINSYTVARGCIDLIPEWCITIGMKEILSARKIRFYLNREWQCGIVRKILHGPVSPFVPASFFQEHPDVKLTISKIVAELPMCQLK